MYHFIQIVFYVHDKILKILQKLKNHTINQFCLVLPALSESRELVKYTEKPQIVFVESLVLIIISSPAYIMSILYSCSNILFYFKHVLVR